MTIRPKDAALASKLARELETFSASVRALPGIGDPARRDVFVAQLIESLHRVDYIRVVQKRQPSADCADPSNALLFDPVKAAMVQQRLGNIDEACWLVFLFVHFGKHSRAGYRYAREIYGGLGSMRWDWPRTSADPSEFRHWLHANADHLKRTTEGPRGFGSHRKYESLNAYATRGTGAAVESYVRWILEHGTHAALVEGAVSAAAGNGEVAFRALYNSMRRVVTFGRTARFDYLAMLGKLGLAGIEPDSTYMSSSTGPIAGARLLFDGIAKARSQPKALDRHVYELGRRLNVGMQALEDALCNWQKSPAVFRPFRG